MEMQWIKYFIAICEEENFTRAATRCGVAQPSLSKAISRLETELGRALFHRTPRVTLTELGKSVEPHFRQIIRSANEVCHEAAQAFFTDDDLGQVHRGLLPISGPKKDSGSQAGSVMVAVDGAGDRERADAVAAHVA
jgi:DNA-binding transcriptional LysR family regulator